MSQSVRMITLFAVALRSWAVAERVRPRWTRTTGPASPSRRSARRSRSPSTTTTVPGISAFPLQPCPRFPEVVKDSGRVPGRGHRTASVLRRAPHERGPPRHRTPRIVPSGLRRFSESRCPTISRNCSNGVGTSLPCGASPRFPRSSTRQRPPTSRTSVDPTRASCARTRRGRKGEISRQTYQRAIQVSRDIVEGRTQKVLNAAFQASIGGSRDLANALAEERSMFDEVLRTLLEFRRSSASYIEPTPGPTAPATTRTAEAPAAPPPTATPKAPPWRRRCGRGRRSSTCGC